MYLVATKPKVRQTIIATDRGLQFNIKRWIVAMLLCVMGQSVWALTDLEAYIQAEDQAQENFMCFGINPFPIRDNATEPFVDSTPSGVVSQFNKFRLREDSRYISKLTLIYDHLELYYSPRYSYPEMTIVKDFYYVYGTRNVCETSKINPNDSRCWTVTEPSEILGHVYCYSPEIQPGKPEDECGVCGGGEGQSVGDPINPTTGNMYHDEVDYAAVGNSPLTFKRRYNSNKAKQGDKRLGLNWRHNYSARLDLTVSNLVNIERGNGRKLKFYLKNPVWLPGADINFKLLKTTTGWQVTDEENAVEDYDANGRLLSITDRKGVKIVLSYDTAGQLTKVVDPYGRQLNFTYNALGQMVEMKDTLGVATQYTYDTNQNLSAVIYADGTKKQYVYTLHANKSLYLTGIVNELGKTVTTWTYDDTGRATSSSSANGVDKTTITYSDNQSTVTNALGQQQVYNYTPVLGRLLTGYAQQANSAKNLRSYDANGNMTFFIDARGSVTQYTYDLVRNLETQRKEAVGTPEERTVNTVWHSQFRLPTQIKVGNLTTDYTYDSQGNALTVSKTDSTTNKTQVWRYTYNAQSLPASVTFPNGTVERYTYDSAGNLATQSNGLNQTTQYTYDVAGRVLSIKGINGVRQQYVYDKRGRVVSLTASSQATGSSPLLQAVTAYQYTAAGQLSQSVLPNGQTLSYTYDDAGRLIKVVDNLGNSMSYSLDLIGNVLSTANKDISGVLSRAVTYNYDVMNRVTATNGANRAEQYSYDNLGNRLSVKNALNQTTEYQYDYLNRMKYVYNPDLGKVQMGYNPLDQLTQVTGTRNESTQYSVNALNEKQKTVSPDTGQTLYTHDVNGNVLSQTDALGNKTEYSYDVLNRVTLVKTKEDTKRLSYDENASIYPGNLGQLTTAVSNGLKHSYQYDGFGRLVQVQQVQGSTTRTTKYSYNAGGQLTSMIYPSNLKVDYQYTGGQVSTVLINGKPQLSQIKYNASGQLIGGVFANGQVLKRTYDTSGNPTATALASYGLDANGTINKISTTPNNTVSLTNINQSIAVTYDSMNRLTGWTDVFNQRPATGSTVKTTATATYNWDTNSNRTRSALNQSSQINTQAATVTNNTQDLSYGAGNRLTQNATTKVVGTVSNATNQAITLDTAGNTQNDGIRQYTYNSLNQLTALTSAGKTTNYAYDISNRRVSKSSTSTPQSSVQYVYAESIGQGSTALSDTSLLGEYTLTPTNIAPKEYVYLGDTPIAIVQGTGILTV